MTTKKLVQISLDDETYERIQELSKKGGLTKSIIIAKLINDFYDTNDHMVFNIK